MRIMNHDMNNDVQTYDVIVNHRRARWSLYVPSQTSRQSVSNHHRCYCSAFSFTTHFRAMMEHCVRDNVGRSVSLYLICCRVFEIFQLVSLFILDLSQRRIPN